MHRILVYPLIYLRCWKKGLGLAPVLYAPESLVPNTEWLFQSSTVRLKPTASSRLFVSCITMHNHCSFFALPCYHNLKCHFLCLLGSKSRLLAEDRSAAQFRISLVCTSKLYTSAFCGSLHSWLTRTSPLCYVAGHLTVWTYLLFRNKKASH